MFETDVRNAATQQRTTIMPPKPLVPQPDTTSPDRPATPNIPRAGNKRKASTKWQRAMRWLHVYTSMIALAVILFFGVTGLLLNHPSWIYGDDVVVTTEEGTLPESVLTDDGGVEFLAVSEFVRSENGVGGEVTNFEELDGEGSINYTGPSYGATVRFNVDTLDYEVTFREEGFANAMRDLHTGSDTGAAWNLAIDASAVFLVFVSVTGLGIQLFLKKRRRKAFTWLAAAGGATAALIWFTMV